MNNMFLNLKSSLQDKGLLVTILSLLIVLPIFLLIILGVLVLPGALFLFALDLSGFYLIESIGLMNSLGTGILIFMFVYALRSRTKD